MPWGRLFAATVLVTGSFHAAALWLPVSASTSLVRTLHVNDLHGDIPSSSRGLSVESVIMVLLGTHDTGTVKFEPPAYCCTYAECHVCVCSTARVWT